MAEHLVEDPLPAVLEEGQVPLVDTEGDMGENPVFEEDNAESAQEVVDDEQFCKICRLGSEEGNPLYYPCKCSGSIRYVHESCLLEWIKHSKTNSCELCKHVYHFTDIYGPPRQPALQSIFSSLVQVIRSIPERLTFLVRCVIVVAVWGCLFPILMSEIWHFILSTETYPLFLSVEEVSKSTISLPFALNPLRLIIGASKGVFIITGLFIGSGAMFLLMEHIEAFLEHVLFMRNHRRAQRAQRPDPTLAPPQELPLADRHLPELQQELPQIPLEELQEPPQNNDDIDAPHDALAGESPVTEDKDSMRTQLEVSSETRDDSREKPSGDLDWNHSSIWPSSSATASSSSNIDTTLIPESSSSTNVQRNRRTSDMILEDIPPEVDALDGLEIVQVGVGNNHNLELNAQPAQDAIVEQAVAPPAAIEGREALAAAEDDVEEENDDDEEEEEEEDLKKHWLIAVFGRRDRDGGENPEQENDVAFTDMVGITGNMLWIVFGLGLVLGFAAIIIALVVLIPYVIGKVSVLTSSFTIAALIRWEESIRFVYPGLLSPYSWEIGIIQRVKEALFESNPIFNLISSVYAYMTPLISSHPLFRILTIPITIGYILCAVAILTFSRKRSPLAITTRFIIIQLMQLIILPIIFGAAIPLFFDGLLIPDPPVDRPPFFSRQSYAMKVTAARLEGKSPSASFIEYFFPSPSRSNSNSNFRMRQAGSPPVSVTTSLKPDHTSSITDLEASTMAIVINNTLDAIQDVWAKNESTVLANSSAFHTVDPHGYTSTLSGGKNITRPMSDWETLMYLCATQLQGLSVAFVGSYLPMIAHLSIGYTFAVAWMMALRNLRKVLKPGVMWFIRLPGDADFSPFLHIANNNMSTILPGVFGGFMIYILALVAFLGLPATIAIWTSQRYFPFKISVPASSFQIQTDWNMAFIFFPICLNLIKPKIFLETYLRHVANFVAKVFGAESILLPPAPVNQHHNDPVPAVAQHVQEQALQPQAPIQEAVPQEAVPGQIGDGAQNGEIPQNNQHPAPAAPPLEETNSSIRFAALRVIGSLTLGCMIGTISVTAFLVLPWIVGSWLIRLWVPDSEHIPLFTWVFGLYILVIACRIWIVFAKIVAEHKAMASRILNNDDAARQNLVRFTFDNVFRSIVILLAMLLIIPVILGFLFRIVFYLPAAPPNVMVVLHSSIHEYANGLMAMRALELLTKLPVPWLASVRAVIDTLSFDTILQVDYSAFLNHLVYPLSSSVFIIAGLPNLVNVGLVFYLADLPEDELANIKRKTFALIPLCFLAIVALYYISKSFVSSMDNLVHGRAVIGRQIHNFQAPAPNGELQAPVAAPAPQAPQNLDHQPQQADAPREAALAQAQDEIPDEHAEGNNVVH